MGFRLAPAVFDRQVEEMGQRVAWRRALACPCREAFSGAATPGCPVCAGKGTSWGRPTGAFVGVTGLKGNKKYAEFGQWEAGDTALTVPRTSPLYAAGPEDRITMLQSSEPFSRILVHDGTARLEMALERLERCCWIADGALVDGRLPRVDLDGVLSWPDEDTAPPLGTQLTITGRRRQELFVFLDIPQDRAHFGGLDLPRRIAARRFDLFGR